MLVLDEVVDEIQKLYFGEGGKSKYLTEGAERILTGKVLVELSSILEWKQAYVLGCLPFRPWFFGCHWWTGLSFW